MKPPREFKIRICSRTASGPEIVTDGRNGATCSDCELITVREVIPCRTLAFPLPPLPVRLGPFNPSTLNHQPC
jgi:hypothetical protein